MADLGKLQKIKEAMGMTTSETKIAATKPVKKTEATVLTKEAPKAPAVAQTKTKTPVTEETSFAIIKRRVWPD